jgi:hypothetical protein
LKLGKTKRVLIISVLVLIVILAVTFLPIVTYSLPYSNSGFTSSIQGSSSVLYAAVGLGTSPFPSTVLAPAGPNSTYLLHVAGNRISYFEPGVLTSANHPAVLNPSGIVKVMNVSIQQWAFGMLNFSATVLNISTEPVWGIVLGFRYPTYGTNVTKPSPEGTYYLPPLAQCTVDLEPGKTCVGSLLLNQSSTLLTGQSYDFDLEVRSSGPPGYATSGYPDAFIFLYSTPVVYPGTGLGPAWVKAFIQAVDHERNTTALTEDTTLDNFAAIRYNTLRAEYQISDYNFTNDYNKYLASSGRQILEEILYPSSRDPATFPEYLHQNAPGHWSGLMNPIYTKYGYFFGVGPTVVVGPGCPAQEIPGPNINITQYVVAHGCDYVIADQIWFIIILGS